MKNTKTYTERKAAAFEAGERAFEQGVSVDACPIRRHQGLANAWKEGWKAASAKGRSGLKPSTPAPQAKAPQANQLPAPAAAAGQGTGPVSSGMFIATVQSMAARGPTQASRPRFLPLSRTATA